MRLIDVPRKTSRKVTSGGRAYHTVAYDVEIWKIE